MYFLVLSNKPVQFRWNSPYLGGTSDDVLFQPFLPLISSEAATDTRFFEPLFNSYQHAKV